MSSRKTLAAILPVLLLSPVVGCNSTRKENRSAPNVAQVLCERRGARALTRRVRAVRDGIHIEVENEAGANHFYIRTAADGELNHGGRLKEIVTTEIRTTMPPGDVWIGCFKRGRDIPYHEHTSEFAELTIVDPKGLWIEPELACEQEAPRRFVDGKSEANLPDDAEGIIRASVPRVQGDDVVVRPGYPETQWHSEFGHIVRDGRAIASVSVFAQHGRWHVSLRRCAGVEIG